MSYKEAILEKVADIDGLQTNKSVDMIALAGNPNAGKTTLFNALTGMRQKVANYPGVTVERKEGFWKLQKQNVRIIDLPGLYSLDATSLDEQIARDVLTGKVQGLPAPNAIIAVVDATNLERNLYLVTQLLEYKIPLVVALTMMDIAEKQKHEIKTEKLAQYLGVPVVAVTASQQQGLTELSQKVLESLEIKPTIPLELIPDENASDNARIFARYNFISNIVQESVTHKDIAEHN